VPSQCDSGRAVVADTTFLKGKPSAKDKNCYGQAAATSVRLVRPVLAADAILRHDPRLDLVLGAGDAELGPHMPVRSVQNRGYFTITCSW
jgi:hypothetical protein